MVPDTRTHQPPVCPAEDDLVRFFHGLLPECALESVAAHLEHCEDCRAALRQLQKSLPSDRLAGQIRRCLAAENSTPLKSAHVGLDRAQSDEATPPMWPATPEMVGQVVGPFLLLAQVGEGGMGVVYKAHRMGQEQIVALKLIRGGAQAGSEARLRFRKEGAAVARLQHPNVVRFFEFGESSGQPYCAMEWVGGGTLKQRLGDQPMPPREAAELLKTLALAVEYAHGQKVIHRDLKPENVLLTEDDQPRISDFGLAKLLDDGGEGPTLSGMILGTPSYMAPEQAAGLVRLIGPATDVYALGVILYRCLTGRVPFKGDSRADTLRMVQEEEPSPPSRRTPEIPAGLDAICLKCLEKQPAQRYTSAEALAEDLDRWLRSGRAFAVRGVVGQCLRVIRRRWKLMVAALLAVTIAAAAAAAIHLRDPDRPLRQIEADLRAGKTVTLIGETGGPKWSRWLVGGASSRASVTSDGTFSVQSLTPSLLQVVPDSQTDHYQFKAQVRHVKSDNSGEVGLFVGQQTYPEKPGTLFFATKLTFNEVCGMDVPEGNYHLRRRDQRGNEVGLAPNLISEGRDPQIDWRLLAVAGPWIRPVGENKGSWHDLVITVTPTAFTGEWDGQPFTLTIQTAQEGVSKQAALIRVKHPDDPFFRRLAPEVLPRGGLGLVIERGAASFRRVSVQPLPNPVAAVRSD
jgi:eukaryotic-like serine/threonine-protein kinase